MFVGWIPPKPNFLKQLNTDRSSTGNLGGLLRDQARNWVKGISRRLGLSTNTAAELWGLRDDLLLAKSLDIQFNKIELDAAAVIELVKYANIDSHEFIA
ncbi:hypothetical protein ACH5RR_033999 [Cinchona calisaya]|uniref:RNase H type-1 domain-containing protein n=1 Tax=Cinchona calisaya TaxID=153742 RepID=A0ABD2YAY3_9GENT